MSDLILTGKPKWVRFINVCICTSKDFLVKNKFVFSRVDTDVDLEVAYSCNIFDVSDSLTYPDIQTC